MLAKRTRESNRSKAVRSDKDTRTTVNLIDPNDFENQHHVKLISEESYGLRSLRRFRRTGILVVYKAMRDANPKCCNTRSPLDAVAHKPTLSFLFWRATEGTTLRHHNAVYW